MSKHFLGHAAQTAVSYQHFPTGCYANSYYFWQTFKAALIQPGLNLTTKVVICS
ncbi:hypothetical protein [Okeania sp. SIO1I7]|uniref:hypothetical protein n=1 Tax=Okeania sp. SIO1I7 TaxID=2607772 RepID=UPI0013FC3959|nr:hypothetical protein [Okeania sp. SIO1I7]NET28945.1 hypothetical protein [Okeania sp. SIO1I7]